MAFTSQACSGLADMVSKLNTFLNGEGWTTNHNAGTGVFAADKNPTGTTWITFGSQWAPATPNTLGVYQWHGNTFNTGLNPWAQTNDSGNGAASASNATLLTARRAVLDTGGAVDHLWVFEDTNYFHAVARHGASDRYVHFGAGLLTKYNDWTGGEYCYAQATDTSNPSPGPTRTTASYLLDGLSISGTPFTSLQLFVATIHAEGLNNEGGSSKWMVSMGNQASGSLGTDRAGNARIHAVGGFRGGPFSSLFGNFPGTFARGLVPMYPMPVFYWNRTTDNAEGPLGYQPDVRGVSMRNFQAEDSVTVGSDTWVLFPSHRIQTTGATAGFTGQQGIAYKQVA